MVPCIHGNWPHDCSNCKANREIVELAAENKKLKITIRNLRSRLSRTSNSLNRRMNEDFERVEFGDYR